MGDALQVAAGRFGETHGPRREMALLNGAVHEFDEPVVAGGALDARVDLRHAFLRPFQVLKEVAALVEQDPGDAARLVEAARPGEQAVHRLRRGKTLGCGTDVGDGVHHCCGSERGFTSLKTG